MPLINHTQNYRMQLKTTFRGISCYRAYALAFIMLLIAPAVSLADFPDPSAAENPIRQLREYQVLPTDRHLDATMKKKFACFLVETEKESQARYEQSYMIPASTPVIELFLSTFPDFYQRRWEGKETPAGGVILLSDIAAFVERYCQDAK
ncbi:MAG: hypothetical protein AB8F65_04485 [Woeseiaceae bacterium]